MGIPFHSCDQDLIHYDKFTYRKSNRRTLITEAKSLRSFGQDVRAAANRNPGPSLTSRCLKCRFPPYINPVDLIPRLLNIASPASPQQHTVKVGYLTSWSADCRRLPCHAPFHIACVTDTDAPFTSGYLNMTPNNVNNSAICQFVCNARKNGGKKNGICSFSFDPAWFMYCLLDRRLIKQKYKYMFSSYNQAEQRRSSLPNLIQQQATMPQWYRIYCASIMHARYKNPPNYSCLWVALNKSLQELPHPPFR